MPQLNSRPVSVCRDGKLRVASGVVLRADVYLPNSRGDYGLFVPKDCLATIDRLWRIDGIEWEKAYVEDPSAPPVKGHYVRSARRPEVYSVGPDGRVDDEEDLLRLHDLLVILDAKNRPRISYSGAGPWS